MAVAIAGNVKRLKAAVDAASAIAAVCGWQRKSWFRNEETKFNPFEEDRMTFLKKMLQDKKAQDLAEYGIALAVIGAGAAVAALAIAGNVEVLWDNADAIISIAAS